jgi:hypothetical protein
MTFSTQISDVGSAMVRRLHDYWQSKRDGRAMPRRQDIDPVDLKELLPYLIVGDFEPEPFRVRYRLVGTGLAEIHGLDFTGMYLDQLDFSERNGEDWQAINRVIFERCVPIYGKSAVGCADGREIAFEFATFPLSDDGAVVNRWVGIEDYGELDAMTIERMVKASRLTPKG